MGCGNSKNIVEVSAVDANADVTANTDLTPKGSKSAKSPTKAKKKGWSLFGFNKAEPEPTEEEKETRPKPQTAHFIKELSKTKTYGSSTLECKNEWPLLEDLPKFDHYNKVQLTKVSYKRKFGGNFPLAGIQLHFSNGVSSPLYQTRDAIERDWPLEEKVVNTKNRRISKI